MQGVATTTARRPVKKLPAKPVAPRQPVAGADPAAADFENAGEVQPDREEQPSHRGDESGRLELEAPARRCSGCAQDDEDRGEPAEGDEYAERVG